MNTASPAGLYSYGSNGSRGIFAVLRQPFLGG